MSNSKVKRITMKLKHPNPLFEKWLIEWRDASIETDSKTQHAFTKALQSLRKYPLPLESGRDCKILNGFGDKLCQMLERKLKAYKNGEDLSDDGNKQPDVTKSPSVKKSKKEYSPAYRSGAYAILVTLYRNSLRPDQAICMTKNDLVNEAQFLCDKSFTKPDPGSYYTAWSSMKTLIDKNLVAKQNQPAKYFLTEEGLRLGHKLYTINLTDETENKQVENIVETNIFSEQMEACSSQYCNENKINIADNNTNGLAKDRQILSESQKSTSSSGNEEETIILVPNTFDVFLVIDNQETSGSKTIHEDAILAELTYRKVQFEVRHLKVGDYAWLCRDRSSKLELMLPYVVERKRMDDFGSSIKDGRYHEQKFRLKQCGIQTVIYLIESHGDNTHTGLPLSTLLQAATNTLVHDNFNVKFTEGVKETALYLGCMTKLLQNMYMPKTVINCRKVNLEKHSVDDDLVPLLTFKEFNQIGSMHKKFTARQLFIRQLIQLKGVSVDKALAIADKYPCPKLLKLAYNGNSEDKNEKLLASLKFGKNNKNIGPAISKTLYQLYK